MFVAAGDASAVEPDDGGEVLLGRRVVEIELAALLLIFAELGSFRVVGQVVEGEVVLSEGKLDTESEEQEESHGWKMPNWKRGR